MSDQTIIRPRWALAIALIAGVFGLMTLKSGGEVLFIDGAGRAAAGDYVPFVLWFNFLAGFAYVATAVAVFMWRPGAARLALLIAVLTLLVFAAFGVHILNDGAYETRTVGAMALRSTVWVVIAAVLRRAFSRAQAASA